MLKQIGKYTLRERIGRGSLSRVYRAVDQQGRAAAIKLSTTQTEPAHLDEFQRDLVSAASVLHPNLVAVHDLGFEGEFPYLVMELVEGRDFDSILKTNTSLSLTRRVHALLQVGDALMSAHEREVFHLDVRPSKIMLGDDGAAKLLDLGLGRLSYDPARLTGHGYLVGSPFYMSPERLNALDTIDAQCDIWSFGVTFYESIAGRHPFYDDDGDRMIGKIMYSQPPPLAGVPPSLNRVILRALEKDPGVRYRNFAELLAETKPIMSELQREESEALMAQALQQTDNGSWHEARRIARKLREMDTEQAPSPSTFEFSESEIEEESFALRSEPLTAAPVTREAPVLVPAAAVASVAEAVKTPDAAPAPVQVLPSKPRPAGTAPYAPVNRARNGATTRPNGSPPATRVTAPPKPKPPQPVFETALARNSQPAVRVLQATEPRGLPWGKIAAVAAVALLAGALSYFFWHPPLGVMRAVDASEDSKALSRSGRIIKPSTSDQAAVPAFSDTSRDSQLATAASADPTAISPADSPVTPPRAFDPKSLVMPKLPVRRPTNFMASLAPPSLGGNVFLPNSAALPAIAFNVPPPPVPPAPQVETAPPPSASPEPAVPQTVQTVQAAHASALRIGGSFAEPALIHSIQPVYPPTAVRRKAQGMVHFQATIAKDGSVQNLQMISGDPLLSVAAKQAVLQWKYRPATLNGEPVEVTQGIFVKFDLNP